MSCERWVVWDELCDLWDERSCVSCKMSEVVWEEFCELWDEWSCVSCEMSSVKELGWTSVREHESSSTKWHTKAALEWVELCKMSCERWVVWDELCDLWDETNCVSCEMSGVVWDEFCDLWDERSCVGWVLWVVWDNLGEVERERSNSGWEGGEGKEYKPKNKSPTQRCEEKT